MADLPISFDDIQNAHERIRGAVHRTPVLRSRTADALCGGELYFKCENFQRMGAFKFRGAYNAIAQFSNAQKRAGVVAFSSGNHAQGVALAARLLDVPATIVMPADAPGVKLEGTRGYGADVVLYDRYTDDREAIAHQLAETRGMTLVPPYDDARVMAGQGTAVKELIEDAGPLDMILVCLGGGGLLAGSAVAAATLNPDCSIIGVEPAAGNDGQQSFRSGSIVHIATPDTIADGAQTQHLGKLPFAVIGALVDDIVTVTDHQLVEAMRFAASRMKIVIEPTGCLGMAAALEGVAAVRGKRVGVVISGGNIDLARFAALLGQARGIPEPGP